jgi:hypothetical protein
MTKKLDKRSKMKTLKEKAEKERGGREEQGRQPGVKNKRVECTEN